MISSSRLLPNQVQELNALSQESDPELYFESLFSFARRCETDEQLETAATIYTLLRRDTGFSGIEGRATESLNALQGIGAAGPRAEFLLRRLTREASEPSMILSMGLAGAAFRVTRLGLLGRLGASPAANFLTRGFGARAAAGLGAFFVEASTFTFAGRGLHEAFGRPQDWSLRALGRDWAGGALTLGSLRAFGWAGGRLYQRVRGATTLVASEAPLALGLFQQGSMLTGLLAAQRLEVAVGLRERRDGATTLVDSLATLLQFHVAGRLSQAAFGASWRTWERQLELQTEALSRRLPTTTNPWSHPPGPNGIFGVPAFASLIHRPKGTGEPTLPTVLMVEGNGSGDRVGNTAVDRPVSGEVSVVPEARDTSIPESGEALSWLPKDPRQMAAALREALSMHPHAAVVFKLGGEENGSPRQGTVLMINANLSRMFGYSETEAVGMSIQSFLHLRDLPFFRDLSLDLQQSATLDLPNTRFRTKDGRSVRCDVTGMVKRINGHSLGFAFIEDISERQRAESELKASEVRLSALVRAMPDMMFRVRRDMTFLDVQMPQPDLFPVNPKQLIGIRVNDLPLPANLVQFGLTTIGRAFETGQFERVEYEIPMPDGSKRYQEARVSPSEGGDEAMIIVRDITDIKQAEANRIAAERLDALQLVGRGLAHDANNVLTVLSVSIQALQRTISDRLGAAPSSEATEDLQTASDQVERLVRMVSEFRELSTEPRAGPPLNPHSLLREAELRRILGDEIPLELGLTQLPWLTPGPRESISRVILNLTSNARDAMAGRLSNRMRIETEKVTLEEPELRELRHNPASIGNEKPGDFMRIRFQDTGSGIRGDDLGRIFEPYFSTKTPSSSGHGGMGLAITRKIVRDVGGFMTVESTPGIGTTFDVYLPRVDSSSILGDPSNATRVMGHPILLVGGAAEAREGLQTRLQGMGFSQILHTETSADALRLLQENPNIAAVLVDLKLGADSGSKLLERVHRAQPDLASILWSPYDPSFFNTSTLGRFGTTLDKDTPDETLRLRLQDLISRSLNGSVDPH